MADGDIRIDVTLDDSGINAEAVKVGKQAGKGIESGISGGVDKSGSLLDKLKGKFSTVFAAIGGITAGFSMAAMSKQIVETGKQFESSMSNVAALSGAAGDELGQLEEKARQLGAETTFSASQAADALGYMALAGWDTEEMLTGVDGVLTLAQAGMMDLGQASDLVTDYLSAFNMGADETTRMVDVLAYAQANANTTVEGLGMALKNCAANANAAGLDIETTSAAISMMANQGLKGSEAGTALTAVMRDMTAKMKNGAIEIGDASVAVMDAEGNYRDFTDIIADVESATDGMGDAQKASALQATFTADSIKGLNLILNAGSDQLKGFRDELYNSSGAGERLADVMTDNLEGDIAEMNSALEELQLKIYEGLQEPLRDGTQFITNAVVPALTTLVQNFDKVGPVLATLGVALTAYRKNWDIVTAAQKLAAKSAIDSSNTFTSYFKTVSNGQTTFYKWNATTQAYEQTQKSMRATIATTTAGIKAQEVAQKASTVAMELGSKAANVLGKALKTMAPVAILSAVMAIADAFRKSAEDAKQLETATDGLTKSVEGYTDKLESTENAMDTFHANVKEIVETSQDLVKEQAEMADSFKDAWDDFGVNTAMADRYTDTIERLINKVGENGEKAKLTAREQAELQAAVEGLNEVTGESYEITDLVNGVLDTEIDTIRRNTDAWKKNIEQQLRQEQLKELIEEEIRLKDELSRIDEELNGIRENEVQIMDGLPPAYDANNAAIEDLNKAHEDTAALLEANQAAQESQMQKLEGAMAVTDEATGVQDGYADATGETADAIVDEAEQAEKLSKEMQEVVKKINETAESSSSFSSWMEQNGVDAVELAKRLDTAGVSLDDLTDTLDRYTGYALDAFGKIEQSADMSMDKMIENLSSNVDATRRWHDAIVDLYGRASSDAEIRFVDYLKNNTGPEYASVLESMVNDTDGKWEQLVGEYSEGWALVNDITEQDTGVMSDTVTTTLEGMVQDGGEFGRKFPETMGGEMEANSEKAESAAQTVADGTMGTFVNTTESWRDRIMEKFGSVVNTGIDEADKNGKAGMEAAANNASDKYIGTLSGREIDYGAAGRSAAGAAVSGSEELNGADGEWAASGASGGESYIGGLSTTEYEALNRARTIAGNAAGEMDQYDAAHYSGQQLGYGFSNGMSSIMDVVIQTACDLARSAVDTIKRVGEEGSPWRTTKRSGRFAGQGLAIGIRQSMGEVEDSAEELTESALTSIDRAGGYDGVVWGSTKRKGRQAAIGLVVGFEQEDPMAQIEASMVVGLSAASIAAMSGNMTSTTNNQTLNFNQPVESPDVIARNLRMQQRYGLAGRS